MPQIKVFGWKPGLNTVHFIKLIRELAGIPLNEAHALVNRILEGETVVIDLANDNQAAHLAEETNRLGAIAEVVPGRPLPKGEAAENTGICRMMSQKP